jgi:hypothetical protein
MKNRYEESAARTDLVLKDCRQKVDSIYHTMVERINALVVIEGSVAYADFIRNLNVVIDKYTAILAHRRGKVHSDKPHSDENPTLDDENPAPDDGETITDGSTTDPDGPTDGGLTDDGPTE